MIMEQIPRYLAKEFTESNLTKVKAGVISEVYMMLESFVTCPKLFSDEKVTEIFFHVLHKTIFFNTEKYTDKFKIFLEERFITVVIKKLPEALVKNGDLFVKNFCKFVIKVLDTKLEHSLLNVIVCNMLNKFSDTFAQSKASGLVKFPEDLLAEILSKTQALIALVNDQAYVTLVRGSKNFKEMVWYSSTNCFFNIVDAVYNNDCLSKEKARSVLEDFMARSQQIRTQPIQTYDLLKGELTKELALYILQHPKILQKLVILASQMDDPMEESALLAATDEINKFEDFLKDGIHKMYTFDTESRGLILRYSKTLLETSHRILASICTDHQKSSETYKQLLGKYNQGFEDYLKAFASLKPDAKIDE